MMDMKRLVIVEADSGEHIDMTTDRALRLGCLPSLRTLLLLP